MNYQGFISVHRSLLNKGWYNQTGFVLLWIHLLLKANHKEKEFWFNGQNVKVKRGQFVTGRKVLSQETGISESKIERILKVFESEQQIEQQKNNRNRLISIINYNKFQIGEQPTEQPVNNQWTTSEQPVDTNNNDNKLNNEKNEIKKREPAQKNIKPEFDEFKKYALEKAFEKKIDLCETKLQLKYESWKESKWINGNGKKIRNWKSTLLNTLIYLQKEKSSAKKEKQNVTERVLADHYKEVTEMIMNGGEETEYKKIN